MCNKTIPETPFSGTRTHTKIRTYQIVVYRVYRYRYYRYRFCYRYH